MIGEPSRVLTWTPARSHGAFFGYAKRHKNTCFSAELSIRGRNFSGKPRATEVTGRWLRERPGDRLASGIFAFKCKQMITIRIPM